MWRLKATVVIGLLTTLVATTAVADELEAGERVRLTAKRISERPRVGRLVPSARWVYAPGKQRGNP